MKHMTQTGRFAPAIAVAGALALGVAGPAHATNGYFSNGYGVASKGMAGAGTAIETGIMGLAQNPAMGTRLGNTAGFCLSMFAPDRSFTVGGAAPLTPGTYKSDNPLFFVPCGGANFRLNNGATLGIVAYGNGGMNTEYGTNPFAGLGAGSVPLGVNLEQLFLQANYSWDVNNRLSFGIGPIFAIQRFSATGLEAFTAFSLRPGNVTNNGDDWSTGFGVNLGMVWQASDEWLIGAAYRSKMFMSAFDRYSGLFAEAGDFDIPAVASLGASFSPQGTPGLTLTAEYQHIFYGDVAAISNSGAALTTPLGASNGPGFGWKDMDILRIAAQYVVDSKLTVRGGVSYNNGFLQSSNEVLFNTLAPATPRWHASIGGSYQLANGWGLNAAYTHAFDASESGNNLTPGLGQPISLRMSQNEFAIGLTKKW